jgi:hypothetical protein
MKIDLKCTAEGFFAVWGDDAYEQKRKLKVGKTYTATIKEQRNPKFHKKYFALINCAWAYQNERQTAFFKGSVEIFRKTMEMAAGHCERVYSIEHKEWQDVPKSIAFDKMDEAEFRDLYERVKDVLFATALRGVSEEEFLNALANF